jgi:hypothetical protein
MICMVWLCKQVESIWLIFELWFRYILLWKEWTLEPCNVYSYIVVSYKKNRVWKLFWMPLVFEIDISLKSSFLMNIKLLYVNDSRSLHVSIFTLLVIIGKVYETIVVKSVTFFSTLTNILPGSRSHCSENWNFLIQFLTHISRLTLQ